MSDIASFEETITRIDDYIKQVSGRELVSTGEVQDFLLDLRLDAVALATLYGVTLGSTPNGSPIVNDSSSITYASTG